MVAPDLFGFGLSDRLARPEEHQLELHVSAVQTLIETLDLRDIVVVGQDWGGPIVAGAAARSGRVPIRPPGE